MARQVVLGGSERAMLRPDFESYNLALTACWRGADWPTACKLLEMMSGILVHTFTVQPSLRPASTDSRSTARSKAHLILPDAESMNLLARTALASRKIDPIYQALRIANHFGTDHFFIPFGSHAPIGKTKPAKGVASGTTSMSLSVARDSVFHQTKLAQSLEDLVSVAARGLKSSRQTSGEEPAYDAEEMVGWRNMAAEGRRRRAVRKVAKKPHAKHPEVLIPGARAKGQEPSAGLDRTWSMV